MQFWCNRFSYPFSNLLMSKWGLVVNLWNNFDIIFQGNNGMSKPFSGMSITLIVDNNKKNKQAVFVRGAEKEDFNRLLKKKYTRVLLSGD